MPGWYGKQCALSQSIYSVLTKSALVFPSLQECSLETQYMVKCCQEAAGLAQAIASVQEVKPVTHLVKPFTSLLIFFFFFTFLSDRI